jgi:ParB family chromosome partitioning protein
MHVSDTQFVRLDPTTIKIGANVRTDLHADAKEFARSIKERGVLEPVTVYADEAGEYVVLRGQRRTVVAAEVGLADIPAQVVPQPDEADRITDQMVENLHRAAMRDSEIVGGVEQLALVGVSAAQIAKRAALPRDQVNAALAVASTEQTRARVVSGDLTLEEAAIFSEWEGDPRALDQLERARQFGRPLPTSLSGCGTRPTSGPCSRPKWTDCVPRVCRSSTPTRSLTRTGSCWPTTSASRTASPSRRTSGRP